MGEFLIFRGTSWFQCANWVINMIKVNELRISGGAFDGPWNIFEAVLADTRWGRAVRNQSRNLGRGLSALINSGLQRHPPGTTETASPLALPLMTLQAGLATPPNDGPAAARGTRGVDRREWHDPADCRPARDACRPGRLGSKTLPVSADGGPRNSPP